TGHFIAYLDNHGFGADPDVLPLQEEGRTASCQKLVPLRKRVGLSGVGRHFGTAFAEGGRLFGTVDTAATVEGALGPQKLRSIQPRLVVPPQHMAIATLE